MDPIIYKWMHLSGLALTLLALGGLAVPAAEGGRWRMPAHGVGLLLALVGGFGMLAKYKIDTAHPMVLTKIALWLVLGASVAVFKRKPALAAPLVGATWALFVVGAYLGLHLRNG
ncbi:MAG: hypothetical protein FJ138_00260 [Deltaproteobacteria bacterium]|nr:hypothetical protein [Deltaproteobacteria bacterium]